MPVCKKYIIKPTDVYVKIADRSRNSKPNKKGSTSKFKLAFSTMEKRGRDGKEFKIIVCVDPVDDGIHLRKKAVTSTEVLVIDPTFLFTTDEGQALMEMNHRAVIDFLRCPRNDTGFRHVSRKFLRTMRKIGVTYQAWLKSSKKDEFARIA